MPGAGSSLLPKHSSPIPPMKSLNDLKIQLYADGADKAGILDLYSKPYIKGLTTNPSLMKKVGIKDYEAFAKDILQSVTAKPISLEVFTDDPVEMKRQGQERLHEDPNHQLSRRILSPAHQGTRTSRSKTERDGVAHAQAGGGRR